MDNDADERLNTVSISIDNRGNENAVIVGDLVPPCFMHQIHSRFDHAVNFLHGEIVLTIASVPIDPAPFLIRLPQNHVRDITRCEMTPDCIILNGTRQIPVAQIQFYHSFLPPQFTGTSLSLWHTWLREQAVPQFPGHSAGWLLDETREVPGGLQQFFSREIKCIWQRFEESDALVDLLALRGIGIGSTPQGDDLITGYLIGLQIITASRKNDLSKQVEYLKQEMLNKSNNPIVCTAIRMVSGNHYPASWKRLLQAGITADEAGISPALAGILRHGDTSGADTLTGMLLALRKHGI